MDKAITFHNAVNECVVLLFQATVLLTTGGRGDDDRRAYYLIQEAEVKLSNALDAWYGVK